MSTKSAASAAGHEVGYPHGHLGHLSGEEETSLQKFKAFLEEKGLYKPGHPPSHDDATLLRYLRARRWVVEDAFKQFKDTEEWRAANNLEVLYDTIELDAYEQSRRLYPQWTGRRDKRGIPVYLFEIKHLDSKTVQAYEKSADATDSKAKTDGKTPAKLLRLFALYENLTRFVQPLCTELTDRDHAHTPITLSTNIVDVSGVSLRQFWNLKAHMQAASQLATAHYPETLDRIFILGAPMFFSTVWGWIKRWFDPITVSKIFILSAHEVKPTLEAFIDVRNIPKQYGGELDFAWGEMPNMDPYVRETVTWENGYTDFPKGPLYWRPIDGGKRLECVASGCNKQVQRMERVCTMPKGFPEEEEKEEAEKPAVTTSVETAEAPTVSAAPVDSTEAQTEPAVTTGVETEEKVPEVSANGPTEADIQGVQNLTISSDVATNGDAHVISEKVGEVEAEVEAEAEPAMATAAA